MSLARTNPIGWAVREEFTSAQANGIDVMITNGVDKRSGALEIDSQDVSIWNPLIPSYVGTDWAFDDTTGTTAVWRQTNVVTTGAPLYIVFPLVNRGYTVLKSVEIFMTAGGTAGTAHANFPTGMPVFALIATASTAPAFSTLQSVTSTTNTNFGDGPTNFAGTIANYNGAWSVKLSNTNTGFGDRSHSSGYMPYVRITGENNANAVASSLLVLGIKSTWTCTKIYATG